MRLPILSLLGAFIFVFFVSCEKQSGTTKVDYEINPVFLENFFAKDIPKSNTGKTLMLFHNEEEFNYYLSPAKTMLNHIVKPDFNKSYVVLITHNPDNREIQVDVNKIKKINNDIYISYSFCENPERRSFKTRALSVFTLPKDSLIRNIVCLSPDKDTLSFSTDYQNKPFSTWSDSYEGVLPCADCPGIKTVVKMSGDYAEYEVTRVYIGKMSTVVMRGDMTREMGFGKDKTATVYTFHTNKGDSKGMRYYLQYSARPEVITLLSPEKQKLDSDLEYVLFKRN